MRVRRTCASRASTSIRRGRWRLGSAVGSPSTAPHPRLPPSRAATFVPSAATASACATAPVSSSILFMSSPWTRWPGLTSGPGSLLRGSGNAVRHATIRGTQGPALLVDSSAGATIAANDLAGRQRLALIRWSTGATVQGNLLDTRPLGLNGEVSSGGTLFEWAALEMQSSWQAVVTGNSFRDLGGANQDPYNAMRFVF